MSRRERGDDGVMLVELLVGMVLMAVVGTVVLDGIVGGFRAQRSLQARGDALTEVRTAAQRVLRHVREADPVLSATPTDLIVKHGDGAGGTLCFWWRLDSAGSRLTQATSTSTNCASNAWGTPVTVIGSLDPTVLPFTYGPRSQWTAPSGSTVNASTCISSTVPTTTFAPPCIGTVTLNLTRSVAGHTPVVVNAVANVRNPSS